MNSLRKIKRATHLIVELTVLSFRVTLCVLTTSFSHVLPVFKKSLLGETVLVTGAGDGVGRELAIKLGEMGCIVICWDSDKDLNVVTKNVIIDAGGEAYDFTVDVSNRTEVREAARLMRKYRVPDVTILVNNFTVVTHKPFINHDADDVEKIFGLNVFSHFWTVETFLPAMLQNRKGHIVAICGPSGLHGAEKATYSASKFAIQGLMTGLHEEYKSNPFIHFTTIFPFYIATGLARDPKYRLSWIFGAVSPAYVAGEIVNAVQRNYKERTIPKWLYPANLVLGTLPQSSVDLIMNFLSHRSPK